MEGTHPYLALHSPRLIAGVSHVRLREGEVDGYAEATGFRMGGRGRVPVAPGPAPSGDGDLMFLNAAASDLVCAFAPYMRRERRRPGSVPEDTVAAFERVARLAWLGSCGLLGEADLVQGLRAMRNAVHAAWGLVPPSGFKAEIVEGHRRAVDRVMRDIDGWVMPRALAREARFDAEDVPFLSGPGGTR